MSWCETQTSTVTSSVTWIRKTAIWTMGVDGGFAGFTFGVDPEINTDKKATLRISDWTLLWGEWLFFLASFFGSPKFWDPMILTLGHPNTLWILVFELSNISCSRHLLTRYLEEFGCLGLGHKFLGRFAPIDSEIYHLTQPVANL